jgi:hypothetical protein
MVSSEPPQIKKCYESTCLFVSIFGSQYDPRETIEEFALAAHSQFREADKMSLFTHPLVAFAASFSLLWPLKPTRAMQRN